MAIEVELRSFITKEKYEELLGFFGREGRLKDDDFQESHYFDCGQDLRIQRNNHFSKIWLKGGKLHDEQREEIEVKCRREDFEKLEEFFGALGLSVAIKWFRRRHTFGWKDVDVMLDYTKGYGYIIELEKMATESDREEALALLKERFRDLGIEVSPKEEFEKKFEHYRKNWEKLV